MAGSPSAASELAGAAEATRRGRLEGGGASAAVTVGCASRLSLHVRFDGPAPRDGARFAGLILEGGDGGQVRLSACRFDEGRAPPGYHGRLVFVEDVYDCRAVIHEGTFSELRAAFQNLPLVLSQREAVRPEFARWVADLVYDLSVFRRFFDDLDRTFADEPAAAATAARAAVRRSEGEKLIAFLVEKDAELVKQVQGYSKEEHERHGFYLRRMAWHLIVTSGIHRRTNLKPRGYAGDAEMMRLIYENGYAGDSLFGELLHKHAVAMPGAEAVRNRRRIVPRALREVAARFADLDEPLRFLSLASGPAAELQDLFTAAADCARFEVALLDQDPQALEAARGAVAAIEAARGARISARYLADSVRTMLRDRRLGERLGTFHAVYSMGLFDYLSPPVAKAVLARAYDLVVPGGMMLVGNYHVAHASRRYMDYWLDWPLYTRTRESFLALAEGLSAAEITVDLDDSGCQMFLRIEKGGLA
jgi:extracellular factor (EF) 3-hydroxypalmitic acid methyl ester biosynthesis protein